MLDGAAIGGNGTIGGMIVYNGGTAAPGNSIGTLHVAGNVTFEAGSTYQVEINAAGASDQVVATGVATIEGGTVAVLAEAGNYAPATEYTILTANGGVNGTFNGVTTNLAFLAPSLNYSANSVRLSVIRNDIDFAAVAVTPNQRASATAAEALGTSSEVYSAVVRLSEAQAVDAFDSLSGEVHATARTLMAQDAAQPRQAVIARIDGMAGATERGAWLQPFGVWGEDDGDGNAAAADRTTAGMMVGADFNVNGVRLGIAGGLSRTHADIDMRASEIKLTSGHAMAYFGADLAAARLSAGAGYTWTSLHSGRTIAAGSVGHTAAAGYGGTVLQAFAEAGIPLALDSATIEPFGGFNVVQVRTDEFSETGGVAALDGSEEKDGFAFSSLGLKLGLRDVAGLSLNAEAAWHHGFGDLTPSSALAFANGDAFEVAGAPLSRDSVSFKSDVTWRITPTTTFSAGYRGEFGSDGNTHGAEVVLSVGF